MYFPVIVDDEEIKKAKGVNNNVVRNTRHEEYINVLFNKSIISSKMEIIQSKLRIIGTFDVFKISLSCFNDKRYMLDHGIKSLAYFHKDVKSQ